MPGSKCLKFKVISSQPLQNGKNPLQGRKSALLLATYFGGSGKNDGGLLRLDGQ